MTTTTYNEQPVRAADRHGGCGYASSTLATTYTYDAVGNLTQVNGPLIDVTDTVTTAYDAERRPTQVTNARGRPKATTPTAISLDRRPDGAQWLVSCRTYTPTNKLPKA